MEEELFALFQKARLIYLEDVVRKKKAYSHFVEDFYHGNRYIRCQIPLCRNVHEVNLHIVYEVLVKHKALAEHYLFNKTFTPEDCVQLRKAFDSAIVNPPKVFPTKGFQMIRPPLTFKCNLTQEQIIRIAAFADTNCLFSFYNRPEDDLRSLFECRQGFHLVTNNVRNIAVMFDALHEAKLIGCGWQTVMEKRQLLYSKNGALVSASVLSSALHEIKKSPTATSIAIQTLIKRLKE